MGLTLRLTLKLTLKRTFRKGGEPVSFFFLTAAARGAKDGESEIYQARGEKVYDSPGEKGRGRERLKRREEGVRFTG